MGDGTHLLQLILSVLQIQVPPYLRIFLREFDDLAAVQVVKQARVDLPRELIEELVEEFDVDEHGRRIGELVRDDVQKRFRTEHITFGPSFTPLRLEGRSAEFEDTQPVSV